MLYTYRAWEGLLLFLMGSSIFSFVNVLIYRVPRHQDIISGHRRCAICGHELSFIDILPVAGWFLQRGRCRYCQSRMSFRYPLVEIIGGCLALVHVWKWGISWQTLCTYAFLAVLTAIAFVDMDTKKIPNCFIVALGFLSVWSLLLFAEVGLVQRGIGMLCVSLPMFLITMIVPGGFGGGDIKLMAVSGLFLGYELNIMSFVAAILVAGVYCIGMLAMGKIERKSRFALGPFLCLGIAGVVVLRGI